LGVNDDSRKFKETYATDEKKGDYISESIEDNNATYQSNQKIPNVDEFVIRKKEKIFNSSVIMFPSDGNELKESQVEQIKIRKEKEMLQNLVLSNTNITYSQFRENKDNVNAAHSRYSRKHQNNTVLLSSDVIYGRDWWGKPVVIEEFKFVFFPFPKVGSSYWKRLLRNMTRLPDIPERYLLPPLFKLLLDPATNNLTTLDHFSLKKAQHIMTDSEWTRATFVRDPKERILSAYMNKFVHDSYFIERCCEDYEDACRRMKSELSPQELFPYFLNRTLDCPDPHWEAQVLFIDDKWWPNIDFIGYMTSISEDSKTLLKSIRSDKDGISAWDTFGKSGWGESSNRGFMQKNEAAHATNSSKILSKYYTPELEKFVEKHWEIEWKLPEVYFERNSIFHNKTMK